MLLAISFLYAVSYIKQIFFVLIIHTQSAVQRYFAHYSVTSKFDNGDGVGGSDAYGNAITAFH
uniref:Uncharacterized protein n=1 Tax=Glossina palpalis gambiensis TaxID=67801 RepID=A0A1B0BVL2_9MUSC